jgi:hypothetical protein
MTRWQDPNFMVLPLALRIEIATNAMERAAWDAEAAERRRMEAMDVLCQLAQEGVVASRGNDSRKPPGAR